MELLLEDKALACNREVKYHKFAGSSVELKDLGNKGRCQNILRCVFIFIFLFLEGVGVPFWLDLLEHKIVAMFKKVGVPHQEASL